jgi:hypothetical protein
MNCIECDRPANGICRFCGRALCKDHFKVSNYILSLYPGPKDDDKVLIVKNVVKCQICQPQGEFISLNLKEFINVTEHSKRDPK